MNAQKTLDRIQLYLSLIGSLLILIDLGYRNDPLLTISLDGAVRITFYVLFANCALLTIGSVMTTRKLTARTWSSLILIAFGLAIVLSGQESWMYSGVFLLTLTEISKNTLFFDRLYFNPTILFVVSFLLLITIGAFLFMLPNSTHGPPMSFVDALFMATSAVCITGLSVVDVATEFTRFGQSVLLILIQMGGLGIMTFTGFFGYFFSGGFSYKNQIMYGEILGQNRIGSVVKTMLKIIFLTLFCETIGVALLFFQLDPTSFSTGGDRIFFAVFHAVSAFCNAGFSTLEQGAQHSFIKYNYMIQLILAGLFLAGGLGFTIIFNGYAFVKRWSINVYRKLFLRKQFQHKPWVISFNARLMAVAAIILTVVSTGAVFILEYDGMLREHQGLFAKLVTSFFNGSSARTTGFYTGEMQTASVPLTLIFIVLMWIGASPGSTGGGIKTTTFTVALLSILSLAKGKDRIEIFRRQIANESISKAFAIIMLSIIAIGTSVFLLSITNSHVSLKAIIFESFSAYATCGLSLGATSSFNDVGKVILTMTMFVGRVGLLTILVALIKDLKSKSYQYPQEQVLF